MADPPRTGANNRTHKRGMFIWDSDAGEYVAWDGKVFNSFNIPTNDFITITYITAGNGIGEIETVVYKKGGSGGTTVATLTLVYDANNKLSTVTQS